MCRPLVRDPCHAPAFDDAYLVAGRELLIGFLYYRYQIAGVELDRDFDTILARQTFFRRRSGNAADHGARLIIVNAEPTPYDERADEVVREPIGTALPEVLRGIRAQSD